MKGLVFVELLAMAEDAFGEDVVDAVLDKGGLTDDGAYTAVGKYPCAELIELVDRFSRHSGLPAWDLQKRFGHWMLDVFARQYGNFFERHTCALDLLMSVETEIHVEVRKLFPDARTPRFEVLYHAHGCLDMRYTSHRALVPFCQGLIEATLEHYGQKADVHLEDNSGDEGADAVYRIRLSAAQAA